MGPRNKSTMILIVIFIVLFGYYWFFQKNKVAPLSENDIKPPESIALNDYAIDKVSEVSWKFQGNSARVVKDSTGVWKLIDPAIVADSGKINELVTSVISLKGDQKYQTSEVSLVDSGVTKPSLEFNIKKSDASEDKIEFGNKTVDGNFYFVHKNNQDFTILVSSFLVDELKKDPYTLSPSPSVSPAPDSSLKP